MVKLNNHNLYRAETSLAVPSRGCRINLIHEGTLTTVDENGPVVHEGEWLTSGDPKDYEAFFGSDNDSVKFTKRSSPENKWVQLGDPESPVTWELKSSTLDGLSTQKGGVLVIRSKATQEVKDSARIDFTCKLSKRTDLKLVANKLKEYKLSRSKTAVILLFALLVAGLFFYNL